MGLHLFSVVRKFAHALAMPVVTEQFFRPDVGREYGVTMRDKLRLYRCIRRNVSRITSATSWQEHLILVSRVLSLPASLDGDVIECGCFKGSSTASLSLACGMVGRKLTVCDSFAGLPDIEQDDRLHTSLMHRRFEVYERGEFCGRLDEVRHNVAQYGDIDCCTFVKGYFEDTLAEVNQPSSMIFLDVDLHASLRTCLRGLWPHLNMYGYLYTHEALQLDYVKLFFDDPWWQQEMGVKAPGLIGAGSGVPAGIAEGCGLGYAVKLPAAVNVRANPRFHQFRGDRSRIKPERQHVARRPLPSHR